MDLPSSPKEISARGSLDKNPKDEDPGPCMRPRSPFNIPFPLLPVESNTNSAINSIDIGVAKGLLSDSTNSIAQNLSSNTSPVRGRSNTSFWGLDGSSLSCPDRSAIVPSVSSCQVTKDGHDFVHEYDLLANQHCLPNFGSEPSIPHDFLESSLAKSANWLMKKVFRQASPTHTNGDKNMTKQKSLGEISRLYRSKKDSLEGICLDDIVRLGGCTTLILPSEFSISALSIPPCIGASAVFIAEQGIKAAGIFRIPGQSSIVKQLYEYYAHQFQQADALGDNIQQAVSYSQLPGHIPFTIHDVASTFKKVLSGLPGGIIGSVALLEALYSILYNLVVDEVVSNMPVYQVKARLIALAILAQGSENRFALINTVIGLLAMIGREAERANSRRASEASSVQDSDKIQKSPSKSITVAHPGMTTSDLMTYHALGVVFGPLLAGDLIGQFKIPTANEEDSTGDPTFASEGTRRGKKKSKNGIDEEDSQQDLLLELKKVKILSEMAEMLVKSWEEVVRQMAIVKRVDRPVGLGLGMGILGTSPKHAIRRPVKARINENAESSTSSSGMQGQTLSYTPLPSARASSEKPLSDMIDEALLSPRKASKTTHMSNNPPAKVSQSHGFRYNFSVPFIPSRNGTPSHTGHGNDVIDGPHGWRSRINSPEPAKRLSSILIHRPLAPDANNSIEVIERNRLADSERPTYCEEDSNESKAEFTCSRKADETCSISFQQGKKTRVRGSSLFSSSSSQIISGFRGWDQENARDSDEILEKPLAPRVPSANIRSKKSMRSFFFHPRSRSGHTSSSLSSSEFDSISRSVTSANCDDHTSAAYPNYPANTAHNYFPSTSAREDLFPTKTSFLENHNNTQNQAKKRGKGLVREMARRIQRSSDSRDSSNGSSVHTNLYTHSQPLPILYSRMSEDGCEALPANITVRTRKSSPYLTSLKQNSPIGAKFMATRVDLDINQTWNPDQAASPSNAERYPTYINMRQMSTSKDGPSQGQNKVTNRKHDISGVLRNARSTSDNRIAFSEHELFAQKQYEESYTRQGKENMILARSQSQRFAPSKKSQIPNLLRVESSKSRGWARLRSRSLLSKTPSSLTAPHPVAGLVNSKTATSSSNIPVSSPSKLNQIINLRVQGRSVVAARDDEIAKKSPKQVQQPYTPQKQTALESKLSFRFSPMAAGDNTFPKPSSIPKPVFGVSKARRRPDCTALSDAIISPTKLPPRVTHEELGDPNGAISTPKQLKPIKQIAYVSPRRSSSRPPSPTRAHELESNPCGIMSPDKSMLRNDSAPLSPVYVSPPTTVLRSKSSTVHTHVRFNVSSSGSPENKMPGPANSPPNADIFDMPRRSLSNSLDLRGDLVPVDGNLPTFANAGVNATLYAEIRRLQRLLEMRTEEASGAMKELRGLRQRMVGDRGRLLGEREREGGSREEKEERESKETVETRAWRNRAEWAEKRLLRGAGLEGGDEVDAKSASARRRGAVKR